VSVYHTPVMVREIIDFLMIQPGHTVVDGTVGEGGHSVEIAKILGPDGVLIGIDRDKDMLNAARKRVEEQKVNSFFFNDKYSNINSVIANLDIGCVNAVLLDLGFSTRQIEASGRGFSFLKDEILDMRFDIEKGIPAHEWLNNATAQEIKKVLKEYGEEPEAARIARRIVEERDRKRIMTSFQLAEIIKRVKKKLKKKINPATKTFQAIRIFINNELEEVRNGVSECIKALCKSGRLAVLTYHSLEDRIVKSAMNYYTGKCKCPEGMPVCRCRADEIRPKVKIFSAVFPSEDEIKENFSVRSAKLRGCEVILK